VLVLISLVSVDRHLLQTEMYECYSSSLLISCHSSFLIHTFSKGLTLLSISIYFAIMCFIMPVTKAALLTLLWYSELSA